MYPTYENNWGMLKKKMLPGKFILPINPNPLKDDYYLTIKTVFPLLYIINVSHNTCHNNNYFIVRWK